MDTMESNLMRMLMEGPEVSLNRSPTVSPATAALCASLPFPPCAPPSIYFSALPHAPPAFAIITAKMKLVAVAPASIPQVPSTPSSSPTIIGEDGKEKAGVFFAKPKINHRKRSRGNDCRTDPGVPAQGEKQVFCVAPSLVRTKNVPRTKAKVPIAALATGMGMATPRNPKPPATARASVKMMEPMQDSYRSAHIIAGIIRNDCLNSLRQCQRNDAVSPSKRI